MPTGSKATKALEEAHRSTEDFSLSEEDNDDKFDGVSDNLSSHGSTAMETTESIQLAAAETRLVWWSKLLMLFVLGLAAMACVVATFLITQASELNEFKNEVENHANEIIDLSKISAGNTFLTIEGLSVTITSYALDQEVQWPFLVIPHFDFRTKRIRRLVGGNPVTVSPFVTDAQRALWEQFTVDNQDWVPEDSRPDNTPYYPSFLHGRPISVPAQPLPVESDRIYLPSWQRSPVQLDEVNSDILSTQEGADLIQELRKRRKLVLSSIKKEGAKLEDPSSWPTSLIGAPIFSELNRLGEVTAVIGIPVPWHTFFENILPEAKDSMIVVVQDTCGMPITYRVDGPKVTFVGAGDLHDTGLEKYMHTSSFDVHDKDVDGSIDKIHCFFNLKIYPSRDFFNASKTSNPILYSGVVFAIFLVTSLVFLLYDCFVQKRQKIVMTSAQRSNAIVSSLFPEQVRDRLMEDAQAQAQANAGGGTTAASGMPFGSASRPVTGGNESLLSSKPIADLFPHATVMFADICDFTAWASVREPAQVFTLLEQIYSAFDVIAKRRRIFKVETIGDCYVAVAGLPEPRKDHAVVMARFAHACRVKLVEVVKDLEVLLGPDTADLGMRFGLHSGPVTAGVLRGEKSRFQLFGDTVNTAARIESSGRRNMVHISSDTANLLKAAGKGDWCHLREGLVSAKGKGMIQTFWLTLKAGSVINGSTISQQDLIAIKDANTATTFDGALEPSSSRDKRTERLIEWNCDVLIRLLKRVIAMRDDGKPEKKRVGGWGRSNRKSGESHKVTGDDIMSLKIETEEGKTVLDEVKEIITLSNETKGYKQDPEAVELDDAVVDQIRDFVTKIAGMYHDNSFHSFEHASHVTQSVIKLLSRIVTADDIDYTNLQYKKTQGDNQLHEYTYGITSDPIIQFSCALSAMIHDADHQGVGNATLVAEGTDLAKMYKNKSVAEQNSVDLAWGLLMQPEYAALRACIYTDQAELDRFRQLVVNSVMATDIVDKELGAARKARWAKAFALDSNEPTGLPQEASDVSQFDSVNRKATIVIEHIIQASDVSHTMQHWHVYIKWNEKLFHELYRAHLDGRGTFDPSQGWYKGELGFYDFYIIPLAKKLKECGVFGVASDEYLNYALANRAEWEQKGQKVLEGYMAHYRDADGNLPDPKPKAGAN